MQYVDVGRPAACMGQRMLQVLVRCLCACRTEWHTRDPWALETARQNGGSDVTHLHPCTDAEQLLTEDAGAVHGSAPARNDRSQPAASDPPSQLTSYETKSQTLLMLADWETSGSMQTCLKAEISRPGVVGCLLCLWRWCQRHHA